MAHYCTSFYYELIPCWLHLGSQSSWVIPVSFMKYNFDHNHMNSAGDDSMYHMRIAGGLRYNVKIQSPPCCILIFLFRVVFSVSEVGFHVLSTHPPPSLLGPRRSYYPNETRQETSILCAAQNPDVTFLWSKFGSNLGHQNFSICAIINGITMKYHNHFIFNSLGGGGIFCKNMADVKLKHQASYGEAGMKSYFSSIFSTSFVFAFVLFLLDFLHCFVFVFAVCAILILALILILILIHESWILILIWLLILNPNPDYSLSISSPE